MAIVAAISRQGTFLGYCLLIGCPKLPGPHPMEWGHPLRAVLAGNSIYILVDDTRYIVDAEICVPFCK